MKLWIGIDPGKEGAIVILNQDGRLVGKHTMPMIGKGEFDGQTFRQTILDYIGNDEAHICVEQVHAIYGSAAGATFSFGWICGAIFGIVSSLNVPYSYVQPKAWQRLMYEGIAEIRKPPIQIKIGKRAGQMIQGKLDCKKMSEIAARRLFPTVDLRASERCKKAHDGIVDALLIAEYCRRTKS